MVRKNIVVIRVVTLEDQTLLRMHGDLIEAYYPALRTDSYCIGEQPRGVCDLKTKPWQFQRSLRWQRSIRTQTPS